MSAPRDCGRALAFNFILECTVTWSGTLILGHWNWRPSTMPNICTLRTVLNLTSFRLLTPFIKPLTRPLQWPLIISNFDPHICMPVMILQSKAGLVLDHRRRITEECIAVKNERPLKLHQITSTKFVKRFRSRQVKVINTLSNISFVKLIP
jgi:hypothetical protein